MSHNESFEQLTLFEAALRGFNDHLAASVRSIQEHHAGLEGEWQDDFRKEYDRRWETFHSVMVAYLDREAPEFERFLVSKIDSLDRFLHG